ncbi:hypothetical protein BJ170DRAFT_721162 [Xylariales sp. AK1849]|nr:hypothetical protein BJ170DRAFT_721162 [Xylariales sp. AK1849]
MYAIQNFSVEDSSRKHSTKDVTTKENRKRSRSATDDEKCSICRESDPNLTFITLPCNHIFHKLCIDRWISSCETNAHCPHCRQSLHYKSCNHRLYALFFLDKDRLAPDELRGFCPPCAPLQSMRDSRGSMTVMRDDPRQTWKRWTVYTRCERVQYRAGLLGSVKAVRDATDPPDHIRRKASTRRAQMQMLNYLQSVTESLKAFIILRQGASAHHSQQRWIYLLDGVVIASDKLWSLPEMNLPSPLRTIPAPSRPRVRIARRRCRSLS